MAGRCRWDAQREISGNPKNPYCSVQGSWLSEAVNTMILNSKLFRKRLSIFQIICYKVLDYPDLSEQASWFSALFWTRMSLLSIVGVNASRIFVSFTTSLFALLMIFPQALSYLIQARFKKWPIQGFFQRNRNEIFSIWFFFPSFTFRSKKTF